MSNRKLSNLHRGQLVSTLWDAGNRDIGLVFGVVIHPSPKMPSILWERQTKPRRFRIHDLYETMSIDMQDVWHKFNKAALKQYGIDPRPTAQAQAEVSDDAN